VVDGVDKWWSVDVEVYQERRKWCMKRREKTNDEEVMMRRESVGRCETESK